ncbi:MAG: sigma-54 dependent transcriptional regulator [Rhodobacteraceae bacterium]|nr:sigma-54 dependent transcriptional regulator [Paracoccaceae bacterium]
MPLNPDQQQRRVLIVEDDHSMRDSLTHLLTAADWSVTALADPLRVIGNLLSFQPDVLLSDVRMPRISGIELLKSLPEGAPPMVLISAHGDIPTAVEAMSAGAYSFIEKPFDPRLLLNVLRNAADRHLLSMDAARLRERLARLSGLDRILLGRTSAISAVREQVIDLAAAPTPAMVLGETGTGKELVARALHDLSPRSGKPFIAVNCAAIPATDFDARMFGDGGEETGAMRRADGGTLFLDELSACPPETQTKLLRAVETMEAPSSDGSRPRKLDLRWVSASNDALEAAVSAVSAAGGLRADLFYRLSAVIVRLPALRERREDIPLLFEHFITHYAQLYEIEPPTLSAEDIAALMAHDWPGNVRELRNVAERRSLAAKRGRGSILEAIGRDGEIGDVPETLRKAVAAFERQLIGKAIRQHGGRMDAVAEALGIGRRTLNEKIVKLGLDKSSLL